MGSNSHGRLSALLSATFFGVLALLVALSLLVLPEPAVLVEPIFVVIALAPVVVYLAVSGKLRSFRGGGFEITLREQAEQVVDHEGTDRQVEFDAAKTQQKQGLRALLELDESDPPTTLTFALDRWGYYTADAIDRYLEELGAFPEFSHVVLTQRREDDVDPYVGHLSAGAFERLVEETPDIVELLETGDILGDPRVRQASVRFDATNREVLAAMDDLDVNELAVTGPKGEFVGFVTQDEIVRTILAESIRAA